MRPSISSSRASSSLYSNMKPQFDGTMKEAGAHLEKYVLEHENGARAIVDTKTATCISWIDQHGVQIIGSANTVHMFPDSKTPLKGHFVPEERAKKVSFDRMIFKNIETGVEGLEYRCDVTMRADCLEYDIVIKNAGDAKSVSMGLSFNIDAGAAGYKVTSKKGYTEGTDSNVATGSWIVPVGKFKETEFYCKISK